MEHDTEEIASLRQGLREGTSQEPEIGFQPVVLFFEETRKKGHVSIEAIRAGRLWKVSRLSGRSAASARLAAYITPYGRELRKRQRVPASLGDA
jgi:hypothetical protein